MAGSGFYNRHSSLQAAGIAVVLPLWRKVANAVQVGDENLVIADYGSSQGRNLMVPMRAVFEPTIAAAIPADRDRVTLIDDLFSRFAIRLAAAPKKNEHYLAVVVLSKVA
jgi:hypothetical protein